MINIGELAVNIRDKLRSELDYIRGTDIYLAKEETYFPHGIKFPAIGIKDSGRTYDLKTSGAVFGNISMNIAIFSNLYQSGESSLVGEKGQKGLWEIEQDVHSSLDRNIFGTDGLHDAFCPSVSGSSLFVFNEELIQQIIIKYEYSQETKRWNY